MQAVRGITRYSDRFWMGGRFEYSISMPILARFVSVGGAIGIYLTWDMREVEMKASSKRMLMN